MKTEMSEKRINELLEMEVKMKKRDAIAKRSYERRNAKIKLMLEKAQAAGISVSEDEIMNEMKCKEKGKSKSKKS